MASEYIKYLTKDEKPAEEAPPLTPKERRKNWLYYHKWHLVIGAAALVMLLDLTRSALRIGEIRPDIQIAYTGKYVLPEKVVPLLEEHLASYAKDANGDGRTVVRINTYPQPDLSSGDSSLVSLSAASSVQMMADMEDRLSFLFLMDDPAGLESSIHILAHPDGTLPESEEDPVIHPEAYVISWKDCPGLAAFTAPDGPLASAEQTAGIEDPEAVISYLESLSIGRRGFWTEKTSAWPEACEHFWQALRSGAS